MNIRCKMACVSILDDGYARIVKFAAQYDPNCPEDQKYSKATPSGSMELRITNEAAYNAYKVGQHYYFTSSEIEV